MLTTIDLVLYGFLAVVLLPIVLISLASGSKQPKGSLFAKYYRAEPWLGLTGNVFLLVLCAKAVTTIAHHFGAIDAGLAGAIEVWTNVPFLLLLLAVLGLWIMALRRVHSLRTAG
ncbi:MAG TPA: hypothetical protein VEA77_07940 [Hyphomicrobium sp.]|nr:hypothetical protein [Hyphomicrobium sp.]